MSYFLMRSEVFGSGRVAPVNLRLNLCNWYLWFLIGRYPEWMAMQNSSLGGLSALYQVGGSRSRLVALKLHF